MMQPPCPNPGKGLKKEGVVTNPCNVLPYIKSISFMVDPWAFKEKVK